MTKTDTTFNLCKKCGTKLGTTRVVQTAKHTERIKICPSCRADMMVTYEIHADRFKFLEACENDRTAALTKKLQEDYAEVQKQDALSRGDPSTWGDADAQRLLNAIHGSDPTLPAQVTTLLDGHGNNVEQYDSSADVLARYPSYTRTDTDDGPIYHRYNVETSEMGPRCNEDGVLLSEADLKDEQEKSFREMLAENAALREREQE